jgi:2-(1,2-epoxy-1,2-dihydrophenyl)acetyl-CoA isomerase
LRDQLADEAFGMELSSRSADFREGLKAFAERRRPEFGGM